MTDTPNDGTAGSGSRPPKRPRQGTTANPRVKRPTTQAQATRTKAGAGSASTAEVAATPDPGPTTPIPAPALPAEPPLPGAPRRRRISRYVPAFLSSIIPGLGQLVLGRRTLAALFLFPVVLLVVGVLIATATMGPAVLAATLIEPEVIWGIIGLQVLFVVWRLLAMTVSVLDPAYPKPRARDVVPIGLLILFIVVPQGLVLAVTDQARQTADTVFVGDQATDGAWVPETAAPTFGTPAFTDDPDVLPTRSPSASDGPQRVNVLLIGVDAAPTRNTYLTDTMIVASLDPVAETVSMVSVPRDMVDVPLPNGRRFRGKINSLVSYARNHPREFKGANGKGFDVLQGALGTLLGLKIDYYGVVNLPGFVSVIDKLGGINVSVERSFCDPTYTERGYPRGFSIKAGRRHLDGWAALAYARVRKAAGESDFSRAARQQEVLSGIRDRLVNGGFLSDPIGLLKSLSRTVSTNVPRKLLPDLVEWAKDVDRADTYREVISRPMVRGTLELPGRGSIQVPDIKAIRAMADRLFTEPGTLPAARYKAPAAKTGKATSSGIGNCAPAKTPRPTPKPTKKPASTPGATPKPTQAATPEPTEAATEPPPPPDPTPTP